MGWLYQQPDRDQPHISGELTCAPNLVMRPLVSHRWMLMTLVCSGVALGIYQHLDGDAHALQVKDAHPLMGDRSTLAQQRSGQAPERPLPSSTGSDGQRLDQDRNTLVENLTKALSGDTGQDLRETIGNLNTLCEVYARNPCLDTVLAQLPTSQQAQLQDILNKLPLVQARLSELRMSSEQPILRRLEAVSEVRRQVMGADNAALLFGREEAQLRYQAEIDHFIQHEAAAMPLVQRLVTAQAIGTRALSHYPDLQARLGKLDHQRYLTTLALTLLDATDAATKTALTQEVRAQFFDVSQLEKMARDVAFDAQQQQRAAMYSQQRSAIMARYGERTDAQSTAQRDSELTTLRIRLFPDSFPKQNP